MTDRYDAIFQANATGIEDWRILKAIAATESSFLETAYRYGDGERRFFRRYIQDKPAWMNHRYYHQPEVLAASFGLMQVIYCTATEHGFPREGDWWDLCDPVVAIEIGANYFKYQFGRYGNISSAIAAYNAGTAFIDGGRFSNQRYVDKVMLALQGLRGASVSADH